jgi:hypothetical protein
MRQAKLVVQIVQHANCDHRSHNTQVEWPSGNPYLRWYSRRSLLVCTFDTREHTLRFGDFYSTLDQYIDPGTAPQRLRVDVAPLLTRSSLSLYLCSGV